MAIGNTAGDTASGRSHLEYLRATLKDGYAGNAKTGIKMESRLLPFKFPNLGEMMTLGSDHAMIYILRLRGRVDQWSSRKLCEDVGLLRKDAYSNAGTGLGGGRDGGEAPGIGGFTPYIDFFFCSSLSTIPIVSIYRGGGCDDTQNVL